MARVREISELEAPGDLKPLYRMLSGEYGNFVNQLRVLANAPEAANHFYNLLGELRAAENVPRRYIEIAIVTVSHLNRCTYCVAHHAPVLADLGLKSETIMHIMDPNPPGLDDVDLLVRDYAQLVTTRPWGIRDRIFDELHRQFTDRQIVELTVRIALCGLFNRLNDALQVDLEEGVLATLTESGLSEELLPSPESRGKIP